MVASVSTLPIWKKDSTPSEWLSEIAMMALEHPERFSRVVVIYESEVEGEPRRNETRWQNRGCANNAEVMGVVETGKLEIFEFMKGRRG